MKMALVTIEGNPLSTVEKEKLWEIVFDYVEDYGDEYGFGVNPPYLFVGNYCELLRHLRELNKKDERIKVIEIVEVQ
jgi:hypothetical protein